MNVFKIIECLTNTTSRLEKEKILKEHSDNDILKKVFQYTYDQVKNFGVIKFELAEVGTNTFEEISDDIFSLLDALRKREITGHLALHELHTLSSRLDMDGQSILKGIIERDLRCGVQLNTLKKVWDTFDKFEVMLCKDFSKYHNKIKYPYFAQLKYDASRVIVIVEGDLVQYKTRNGNDYHIDNNILDDIFRQMRDSFGEDCCFDGELYQVNPLDRKPKSRQESNGVATKLVKNTASQEDRDNVGITLWDVVPLKNFILDNYDVKYKERFNLLEKCKTENDIVKICTNHIVNNEQDVMKLAEHFIQAGEEGIIVKSPDNLYRKKRVSDMLKIKDEQEIDLYIVSLEEGTGKYKGRLGALICEDYSGTLRVSVGSGLTDNDRDTIDESTVVGEVVTVKYNAIIDNADKTGKTLFLPRFVEIRYDKDKADDITKIA